MADKDAATHHEQWQQVIAIDRLDGYQQEEEHGQVYQKLEIGACTYLVLKAGSDAMSGADHKQYEQIAEHYQFPSWEDSQVEHLAKSRQLDEGTVEQVHFIVEEGVSEQHPVGERPSYQRGAETAWRKRLKPIGLK